MSRSDSGTYSGLTMPELSIIVAMDRNRLIGRDNQLPWKLPADLQYFKATTMGKPIVMGRKTWESLGRPLPGRQNIVISRNTDYVAEGADVVHSVDEALSCAGDVEEVMIIGGANLYAQALNDVKNLYITAVDDEFEGDAWFPEFDDSEWKLVSTEEHQPDEKNIHSYAFLKYSRK